MNILFVSDLPFNPIVGGLERVTDVLSREFVKRGYMIYYLFGKLPTSMMSLLEYEYPAQLYQLPNYGMFENEENLNFYKQIQHDLKIDVVVNQRGLGVILNKMLPFSDAKLISVFHSTPDAYVILSLVRFIESTAPPFMKLKRFIKKAFPIISLHYTKRKVLKYYGEKYKYLASYSDAIVTLSDKCSMMVEKMIESQHKARFYTIPNPNSYNVVSDSLLIKEKMILYVGRLSLEKNPLRLIKIWEQLYIAYPDWRLVIVGDGEEKQRMKDFVKEKGLVNVIFEGIQSDVAKYYAKASFICLTSNFEGWGMTLTEGMQYGCVPFTFGNYGAAYEIIDDGINGCVISAYNLKEYVSRLSELMSNNEKFSKMSMAAMEKVKMFSVKNIVDQWEELFKSI